MPTQPLRQQILDVYETASSLRESTQELLTLLAGDASGVSAWRLLDRVQAEQDRLRTLLANPSTRKAMEAASDGFSRDLPLLMNPALDRIIADLQRKRLAATSGQGNEPDARTH